MIYELGLKNGEKGRFEHEDITQLLISIENERRVGDTWIIVDMERDGAIRKAYVNVDEVSYIVELETVNTEEGAGDVCKKEGEWVDLPKMGSRP